MLVRFTSCLAALIVVAAAGQPLTGSVLRRRLVARRLAKAAAMRHRLVAMRPRLRSGCPRHG